MARSLHWQRDHPGQLGLALGDGARLVQQDRADRLDAFQAFAALDQDALFSPFARPHHNRGRRRQPQGAWTGHHEHG